MRKLTDTDLTNIAGTMLEGYHVEGVRIKRGPFTDSDHYGIILGRSACGNYVTWEFHLDEDESINPYWGHYFLENREAALRDFNIRDLSSQSFKVTITEKLKLTVEVEAKDRHEAEQIVSDNWKNSEYVLNAENFTGVEFIAVPVDEQDNIANKDYSVTEQNGEVAISDFERLLFHVGHRVEVVAYGDIQNVAVECVDCCEVLYSLDNPTNEE